MPRKVAVTIDGRQIETSDGHNLLDTALDTGIFIPHLCHHPDLKPVGVCGLCVVEIEGGQGHPLACTTPATEGIVVRTNTPELERLRRKAMSLLLCDHPAECLDCPKYLNCELQSLKQYTGITETLDMPRRLKNIPVDTRNPLFVQDFARCINCELCVRACSQLRGVGCLRFVMRGEERAPGFELNKSPMAGGCKFCGACVELCPTGALRDQPALLEGKRRKQALVPCRYTCPAEIDVPRYIRLVKEKRYSEANAVVREKVPFPLILGYVCDHLCESVCRRRELNQAVSIKDLKRFAAENDQERLWAKNSRQEASTGKRVAVVGAGPAGLTAAYYLAKLGHAVTVFEALPAAGGMMRYGIPEYRLSRAVMDAEIQEITNVGVEIRTNTIVGSVQTLLDEDYDAAVIAIGTHRGAKLSIQGSDADGVITGVEFLRKVNLGQPPAIGRRAVVIGGGSVGFDCARVARRLGAAEVSVACLEPHDRMLAAPEEVAEAEEEGIRVCNSRSVTKVTVANGKATGLECIDVSSFKLDEDGKLQVEVIAGSEHVIEADTVIFAIGQRPEYPDRFELETTERGLIATDSHNGMTSMEAVFAAGDAVCGTASIIKAIASGRKAASEVDEYLGGDGDITEILAPVEATNSWLGPDPEFSARQRPVSKMVAGEDRIQSFCGFTPGLAEDEAVCEAARCLNCDLRLTIRPVKFWGDF